jgi:hypothetical protein
MKNLKIIEKLTFLLQPAIKAIKKIIIKLLLKIYHSFCSHKSIFNYVIRKYDLLLLEVLIFLKQKERFFLKNEQQITIVKISCYKNPLQTDRQTIKAFISGCKYLPAMQKIMKKSQGRNEQCNCKSGLNLKNVAENYNLIN